MGLFGKKKENTACRCGANCNGETMKAAEECKAGGAGIKILGSGCAKCKQLEANTLAALKQLGIDTAIDHVTDFTQIAAIRRDDYPSSCCGRQSDFLRESADNAGGC